MDAKQKAPAQKLCRGPGGRICRDWSDCSGKDYYEMSEFVYCRYQILWAISNFLICDGDEILSTIDTWPQGEKETGYTQAPLTQQSIKMCAPYEGTKLITGEILSRLLKTGKDGRLLVFEINHSDSLSSDARAALGYACGWRRKRMDYMTWRRHKRQGVRK